MREIVLDTETTGLDPLRGDRLVEIGCVEIVNRFVTGQVFHRYINPERPMSPEAFAVHGLSDAFLADKPVFRQVAEEFLAFIGDDPLVIHNASFDMGFLNAELKRMKKGPLAADRAIDTLAIARRKHPGQQNSLDALCARYGIDNSRRTKHGALLDSELLAEVYLELIGGRQTALILEASRVRKTTTVISTPIDLQRSSPLPPRLTAAAHVALARYAFPGNVRELENVLERWQYADAYIDLFLAQSPDNAQGLLMKLHFTRALGKVVEADKVMATLQAMQGRGQLTVGEQQTLALYLEK
jgi:DNA polymerase-3 subunit epsilon